MSLFNLPDELKYIIISYIVSPTYVYRTRTYDDWDYSEDSDNEINPYIVINPYIALDHYNIEISKKDPSFSFIALLTNDQIKWMMPNFVALKLVDLDNDSMNALKHIIPRTTQIKKLTISQCCLLTSLDIGDNLEELICISSSIVIKAKNLSKVKKITYDYFNMSDDVVSFMKKTLDETNNEPKTLSTGFFRIDNTELNNFFYNSSVGMINDTRIDNTELNNFFNNSSAGIDNEQLVMDVVSSPSAESVLKFKKMYPNIILSNINEYVPNYNVLRIMSGMAGSFGY